jgi:serine/threonine-protein kinase RsbW
VAGSPDDRFTIDLPAEPAQMATARIFAAAIARVTGASDEVIEDLKLAVSEACSTFIDPTASDAGGLRVDAVVSDGQLSFETAGRPSSVVLQPQGEVTPTALVAELRLELIEALFEGSDVTTGPDGRTVIRFSVPRD